MAVQRLSDLSDKELMGLNEEEVLTTLIDSIGEENAAGVSVLLLGYGKGIVDVSESALLGLITEETGMTREISLETARSIHRALERRGFLEGNDGR